MAYWWSSSWNLVWIRYSTNRAFDQQRWLNTPRPAQRRLFGRAATSGSFLFLFNSVELFWFKTFEVTPELQFNQKAPIKHASALERSLTSLKTYEYSNSQVLHGSRGVRVSLKFERKFSSPYFMYFVNEIKNCGSFTAAKPSVLFRESVAVENRFENALSDFSQVRRSVLEDAFKVWIQNVWTKSFLNQNLWLKPHLFLPDNELH